MNEINKNAPDPKLLPHMVEDREVPVLIRNEDNAELSLARRLDAKDAREQRNRTTKFIASAAAVGMALVAITVRHHEINKDQAKVTHNITAQQTNPHSLLN